MNEDLRSSTPLPPAVTAIVESLWQRHPGLKSTEEALIAGFRAIADVFSQRGILYICGNGGSFADAIHIKGELAKSFETASCITDPEVIAALKKSDDGEKLIRNLEMGFPVVVLGESHSLRSAYENDRDAQFSYAQELNAFAGWVKPGVVFGISTSGNARNVGAAMKLARAYKFATIGFTGPNGGELAKLADIALRVPGESTAEIQENQSPIYHALCRMIETYFSNLS